MPAIEIWRKIPMEGKNHVLVVRSGNVADTEERRIDRATEERLLAQRNLPRPFADDHRDLQDDLDMSFRDLDRVPPWRILVAIRFRRSLVSNRRRIERTRFVCIRRGCPGVGWMALVGIDGTKPSVVHAAFVDGLARAHA